MFEITKYDGATGTITVVAEVSDGQAARHLADRSNARREVASSDHYSVREATQV
jgi:hypothetical protein